MNTWGYFILIAALLVLAALMLYARLATRSREKSLHHAPVELMFPLEAISKAPFAARETATHLLPAIESLSRPGVKLDQLNGPHGPGGAAKEEGMASTKGSEKEYFDELQEAAAGLAMLMRSSPVGRIDPVIFAPDKESDSEPQVTGELPVEIATEVASVEPAALVSLVSEAVDTGLLIVTEETELMENFSEIEDSASDTIEEVEINVEAIQEGSAPGDTTEPIISVRDILGDQVCDKIDQIDQGLDALESLVRSIEASLRSLDVIDTHDDDDVDITVERRAIVSAAA